MTKLEFMDLLRYYFRNSQDDILQEILTDYEEHFSVAQSQGKTEEEITRELGSPKDIYEAYLQEGLVEAVRPKERYRIQTETLKKGASQLCDSMQEAWDQTIRPTLPEAKEKAGHTFWSIASFLAWLAMLLCGIGTVVFLLLFGRLTGGSLQPIQALPPLPLLHPLTIGATALSGIFFTLTFYFLYIESKKQKQEDTL